MKNCDDAYICYSHYRPLPVPQAYCWWFVLIRKKVTGHPIVIYLAS
jgi:hypothetical protein